ERLQRVLQRAIAKACAVLEIERIARAVTKSLDRRREQRVGESILDANKLGIDLVIDLHGAAVAFTERLEQDVGCRDVWGVHELQRSEARISLNEIDTIDAASDLAHPLRDSGCAGQRGTFGQFGAGEQVELILRGDKAARHELKQDNGDDEKSHIGSEYS